MQVLELVGSSCNTKKGRWGVKVKVASYCRIVHPIPPLFLVVAICLSLLAGVTLGAKWIQSHLPKSSLSL